MTHICNRVKDCPDPCKNHGESHIPFTGTVYTNHYDKNCTNVEGWCTLVEGAIFCVPVVRYRIWRIPQVPMKAFHVEVGSVAEAKKLLTLLDDYDEYQFTHNVRHKCMTAGCLEYYKDGKWHNWFSKDGYGVGKYTYKQLIEMGL